MPDCMEEAKKIRKRQIDLAIAGDPLKLAVQEVDDLIKAISLHSIACPSETPALLQKRYSYALQRDEKGRASLKVVLSPQSGSANTFSTILQGGEWPFAIAVDLSNASSSEPLRENVGEKFRLDLPGLSEQISSELSDRQIEPVTAKFVPTNDEVHGLLCRSKEESLAAFAILVVFKMLGAHCSAYLYKIFLPDQFSSVPKDSSLDVSGQASAQNPDTSARPATPNTGMGKVVFNPLQKHKPDLEVMSKSENNDVKNSEKSTTFNQRGIQVSMLKSFAEQLASLPSSPQSPSLSTFFAQTPNELIHLLRNHMKSAKGATGGR